VQWRAVAILILFFVIARSESRALQFVKQIGVGWQSDECCGWMSFVAFGPDGTTVASDGATAPV
jgi:hypothetical protein